MFLSPDFARVVLTVFHHQAPYKLLYPSPDVSWYSDPLTSLRFPISIRLSISAFLTCLFLLNFISFVFSGSSSFETEARVQTFRIEGVVVTLDWLVYFSLGRRCLAVTRDVHISLQGPDRNVCCAFYSCMANLHDVRLRSAV